MINETISTFEQCITSSSDGASLLVGFTLLTLLLICFVLFYLVENNKKKLAEKYIFDKELFQEYNTWKQERRLLLE